MAQANRRAIGHRVKRAATACGWALLATGLAGITCAEGRTAPSPAFVSDGAIAAPDDNWDFAIWDAEHARLLVAHGHDVLVIDPRKADPVRAIGALAHAHAVLAIPGTHEILVSSGGDATVRILDAESGAERASIPVGKDPDAAILSRDGLTAYVMDAAGAAVSVIDLASSVETARIAVKPALEVPVLFGNRMLAVNDEDLGEIEMVDLARKRAVGAIALPGCEGPTGMAYDPESGLSLSSCANGKAALVDLAARRLVGLVAIGKGPDTVIWDKASHRFLVPCGDSGTLSIVRMEGRRAGVAATVPTAPGARTAAFDPASGRLYLPAASRTMPVPPAHRGTLVPGSFHIAVMAPSR